MRTGSISGQIQGGEYQVVKDYQIGADYTKLLAHYDGNDGAKEVVDSCSNTHIGTLNGGMNLVSNVSRIGIGSAYFDASDDNISFPDDADWTFGTGNFTIDCWIRLNAVGAAQKTIVTQHLNANNTWAFYYETDKLNFWSRVGGTVVASYNTTSAINLSANTWYHVAVVRSGATCYMFVNGVSKPVTENTAFGNATTLSTSLYVGGDGTYWSRFGGYIDELRIVKGTAKWTDSFTPSTTPYTGSDIPANGLLLHCEPHDDCGNIPTFVGTAQIDTAQSKFGGGSLLLNGTTDYLTYPDSDDWYFGTSTFTIDFWVRFNDISDMRPILSQIQTVGQDVWRVWWTTSNTMNISSDDANTTRVSISMPFTPSAGTWYHIAWVRVDNGNTSASWRGYIDGIGQTLTLNAGAWNGNFANQSAVLWLGRYAGGGGPTYYYHNGWLDEVRISKGIARWTNNFTPPTSAYTLNEAGTNTIILPKRTEICMTGLDGDNDKEYEFIHYTYCGNTGSTFYMYCNGDTTAGNYGWQNVRGSGSGTGANQSTSGLWQMHYGASSLSATEISMRKATIYAKSGYPRTMLGNEFHYLPVQLGSQQCDDIKAEGHVWNNTTDNLTTLVYYSTASNGIGVGSRFLLARKASVASGMRTGTIQQVSSTEDMTYTKLLSHFSGDAVSYNAESGQSFSYNGTANNFSGPKVGSYCGKWNGTSSYLSSADSTDWDFFNKTNATIDFWVRFDSIAASQYMVSQYEDGNKNWAFYWAQSVSRLSLAGQDNGAGNGGYFYCSWTPVVNTWYHLAVVKSGSTCYMFINGVQQSVTTGTAFNAITMNGNLYVGQDGNSVTWTKGFMDEVRISDVARWTSGFTPQTTAYSSDSNTLLLLHLENNVTDSGNTGHTVTNNSVTFYTPKFGGSLYLDGNSDYVTLADSDDWTISGDFTIDCWVRIADTTNTQYLTSQYQDGTHFWTFFFEKSGANQYFTFYSVGGSGTINVNTGILASPLSANTWYHVAVSRSGNNFYFFVNGSLIASPSSANTVGSYAGLLYIGQLGDGTGYFNGWIDEPRISKGIARWTANFAVPGLPYNLPAQYGKNYGCWQKIYKNVVSASRTYMVIPVNGDQDIMYKLITRTIGGASGTTLFRLNEDSGTNYGHQILYGSSSSATGNRNSSLTFLYCGNFSSGNQEMSNVLIYAKSGYPRTTIAQSTEDMTGTTVSTATIRGSVWNNSSSNITSITVLCDASNGLGVGTQIELYAYRPQ